MKKTRTSKKSGRGAAAKAAYLCAAILFFSLASASWAQSIRLNCGISLEVPDDWHIALAEKQGGFSQAENAQQSGKVQVNQSRRMLFSANSVDPTGAMLHISVLPGAEAATYQQILDIATPEVLREIEEEFLKPLAEQMVSSGMPLQRMNPLRVEAIGGRKSLVISYLRDSDTGGELWEITQHKVPLPGYLVEVTFGIRQLGADKALPFLNGVKRSLAITPVPAAEVFTPAKAGKQQPAPSAMAVESRNPAATPEAAKQPAAKAAQAQQQRYKTSFNCAKASTAIEHAICGHEDLAAKDVALAQMYASVLRKYRQDNKQIKQGQRDWLRAREAACTGDGMLECLRQSYEERMVVLQGLMQLQ